MPVPGAASGAIGGSLLRTPSPAAVQKAAGLPWENPGVSHAVTTALFLGMAGLAAGVTGTAGGITTLVSYPALLAAGIPPLAANVTNSVALLGSGLSSASRAAPDIAGQAATIRRWLPVSITMSAAGAVLLVVTPGAVFARVVPFLVAAGSLILLAQPRISRWQEENEHPWGRVAVLGGLGGVSVYNGYFGAGSGILLIALLLLTAEPVLHRANAVKNVLLAASDIAPAVLFAIAGTVVWTAAIPLGAGAIAGGLIGPSIARRVRPGILRILIACMGLTLAIWLLTRPLLAQPGHAPATPAAKASRTQPQPAPSRCHHK